VKKSIPEIGVKFQKKTYTSRAGLKPISRFTKWFGMRDLVETLSMGMEKCTKNGNENCTTPMGATW
jgi:hypothetical protein